MKKGIKRILIGLGLVLLLVLLAAIVIAAFFQDAVARKLISELNKQLKTEIKVGGSDLSLLRGFPNATIGLQDVLVMGMDKEGLLEAKAINFNFRLLSLFGPNVKVHSMAIQDGALNVHFDKQGSANYDIFKASENEGEEGAGDFNVSLKQAKLENIELIYRDDKTEQEMMMKVEEAGFAGELSSKKYALKSTATLVSNFVDLDGVRYFAGKKLAYNANIIVDASKGTYDFEKVKVVVEDNTFNVTGSIRSQKNATEYDLTAMAENANLASVIAMLPEQYLEAFGDFSSTGRFQFSSIVKGKSSAYESPAIEMQFSLDDGKLTSPRLKEPFKDVSFHASFSNGTGHNNKNSVFEISGFKGYLNRQLMEMNLRVEDLDEPYIDFQADGALPMGYFYGLFNNPSITGGKGEIEFKNLKANGYYKDMRSTGSITAVTMSGDIDFDDAALTVNGEEMMVDRGSLHFDNNIVALDGLKVNGAGSEIHLKGNVRNLLPVLFADSLNSQNAELEFQAELYSPKMDLGRLVKLTDVSVQEDEVKEEVFDSLKVEKNAKQERITDFLKGVFDAKVDNFQYNKIEGKNFSGNLVFGNKEMQVIGSAQAMGGTYKLDGTMFFEKSPRLEAKLDCQKIDVKEFFSQTDNVGQEQLKAENISGTMNSKMLIHAFWDSTGTFLMDQLHVWAGVGIGKGEIKGFKMLEDFSAYAKMQDLRNVNFVDLQNWIEVKNSTFYLPAMFIQNNAMNLTVSGEQSFDDRIEYNIKVNAGQVLATKFKKQNSKLEPIKAKQNGFFNLYFNLTGTLDKYGYETNKKRVKANFERSEQQKSQIRAALIKAFGAPLNMLNEPSNWLDEGESASGGKVDYIDGF